jgi:hypothetical protein
MEHDLDRNSHPAFRITRYRAMVQSGRIAPETPSSAASTSSAINWWQ